MSIDTYLLARTPLSAEEIKVRLMADPELANLGLRETGKGDGVASQAVTLRVRPWHSLNEDALLEYGFGDPTVSMALIRGWGEQAADAEYRVLAAVLRLVPGDVCAELDTGGPLALLRLGGVVYVDPDRIGPENLTDFGYIPERLIVGPVPSQVAAVAARPAEAAAE